jgi:hypothetical protein
MDEAERLRLLPVIEGLQYSLFKHVRPNFVLNRQEYIWKQSGKISSLNYCIQGNAVSCNVIYENPQISLSVLGE